MEEIMDLDALLPKPIKVKISGKVVDLYPGKLKILVRIQDMASGMTDGEQSLEKINEMLDLLSEIIPAIKTDKEIDISPLQVNKIIEVAYKALTPTKSKELNSAQMNPSLDKKKEGSN
jgi:hypothetical protein